MENLFIEKLSRLAPLDPQSIAALVAVTAKSVAYPPRHDLIREGDRPGPVFVMLAGWACRYKVLPSGTRQVLAFLMPGDACDLHVGLLAEMDHSIQTVSRSKVATISRATMATMMDEHRPIARAMYSAQLIDEGTMRAWITSIGRRASIERVAHLMCELYLRARNIRLIAEGPLDLPFSQLVLADALGMTPVHLNRVLRELRERGAMTLRRGCLTISDPDQLVMIAGFDENYLHRRLRTVA